MKLEDVKPSERIPTDPTWKVLAQYLGGWAIIVGVCFALAKLT